MAIKITFKLKEPLREESLLLLFCRWDNQQIKISTRQKVFSDTWDAKKQLCITSKEKYPARINRISKKTNAFLEQLSSRLIEFYDDNYSGSMSIEKAKTSIKRMIEDLVEKMEHFDIFISYRRDGGFETAKHLNDLLVHDGYTVSFDIDTLREGDFDETLLKRIDQCVDFILVVDKHTFDRTLDPDFDPKKDWLRTELAYALKLRKNIIPVLLSGVNGFPTNLPEDIADVDTKNGPEYNKYYFDEFYRRLKSFLHCIPRCSESKDYKCASVTLYSETDVSVSSDGIHIANVKANEFVKIQLELGEHILDYVSIQDPSQHYSEVRTIDEIKNYVIQIKIGKKPIVSISDMIWIILSIFIPFLGFILYFVNVGKNPIRARFCLLSASINIVIILLL